MSGPAAGLPEATLHELRDLALATAREAAGLVTRMRAEGVDVAETKSSPVDVVTRADRASEELVRERLLGARPDDGFHGEEGDDVAGRSGLRWVVDPIDGTVNYLYGIPDHAVSIAALHEGRTVVGVVVSPGTGEEHVAVVGGGATRNGLPLRVNTVARASVALVGTGFAYRAEVRERQGRAVARLLPQVRDVRRRGSCALDLCSVASGQLDGYVEEGPHLWDRAAGGLVATEAGATVEVWPAPSGELTLCAPSPFFDELADLVRSCGFTEADPTA